MTDQRDSARCWIFAALNAMRIPFITAIKLKEFEFSESYIQFWHKVRKLLKNIKTDSNSTVEIW